MRRWNLSHYAISSCVAAALLAGCGGSQPPIGVPGAMPQASALASRTAGTNYKVVYSFGAIPDGNFPRGSLIDVDGTLYGTTDEGGLYSYGCSDYGIAEPCSPSRRAVRRKYCIVSATQPMALAPSHR